MVRVFFQHVDLLFDLFLLILREWGEVNPKSPPRKPPSQPSNPPPPYTRLTSVTSMTLMAASCPVLTCRPCRMESQAWGGQAYTQEGLNSGRGHNFWLLSIL